MSRSNAPPRGRGEVSGVIDLFRRNHPELPATRTIVRADFLDYIAKIEPSSVDGIFVDPYLPEEIRNDRSFGNRVMPIMTRALRPTPSSSCFTTRPVFGLYRPRINVYSREVVVQGPSLITVAPGSGSFRPSHS